MKRFLCAAAVFLAVSALAGCNSRRSPVSSAASAASMSSTFSTSSASAASSTLPASVPAASSSPAVPLSEEELDALAAFLNARENNAFVGRIDYERPEEITLSAVLYDTPCPAEIIANESVPIPVWKMKRQDVDAYLREKTGVPLDGVLMWRWLRGGQEEEKSDISGNLAYEKDTDSFVTSHSDTWLQEIRVTGGERTADGLYEVEYYTSDGFSIEKHTVTLRPVSGGYQFVSDITNNVRREK